MKCPNCGFDAVEVLVPRPAKANPGDRFDIAVEATLDSGGTVTASGVAVAQSFTAPSGWIIGDTHIHSDASDGIPLGSIKSMATGLGHNFTYVTDHIDLIRSKSSWGQYRTNLYNQSSLSYVMVPGLEVTACDWNRDGSFDGDALGFGMPVSDPTLIQNKTQGCYDLVSNIQRYDGATAGVAHPNGSPTWADKGTGYNATQLVGDPYTNGNSEPFWTSSISTYATSCRPSAIGGSDLHTILQSLGPATWLYAPGWSSASTIDAKQTAVAQAIYGGKTAATLDGGLGYFTMAGQYPGADLTYTAGSNVSYAVFMYAPNNSFQVRMTWDFYRGSTRINGGTTSVLPSGGSYTTTSATTVQSGKQGYYLKVRFDYYLSGSLTFSNTTYCGPTYIHQ